MFLPGERRYYVGDIIRLSASGWDAWGELSRALKTGRSLDIPSFFSQGYTAVESFILAMDNTAKGHADQLAARLSLKGRKTLLDVGGGSAAFSIAVVKNSQSKSLRRKPRTAKSHLPIVNIRRRSFDDSYYIIIQRCKKIEPRLSLDKIDGSHIICY